MLEADAQYIPRIGGRSRGLGTIQHVSNEKEHNMMRDIGEDRSGELNNIVLRYGSHGTSDKGMCAMEAVAWLANEPHSDRPACTCSVIAACDPHRSGADH